MRDARFSNLNKLNKCACPPVFAILGHWDTTSASKVTFLSFVHLIGEVGSLQAFPLHKPLRRCCCSSAHDIIWGHDCPCQNAVPTPATYLLILTTWSSFRQWQSRRRGGKGLWISQIQTPKPSSNVVSKGCCAPFPSMGRLNRGPSLGFKKSGLYLFDFRAPLPLNTFSWQNTAHPY